MKWTSSYPHVSIQPPGSTKPRPNFTKALANSACDTAARIGRTDPGIFLQWKLSDSCFSLSYNEIITQQYATTMRLSLINRCRQYLKLVRDENNFKLRALNVTKSLVKYPLKAVALLQLCLIALVTHRSSADDDEIFLKFLFLFLEFNYESIFILTRVF